ncbi:MAG: DUF4465 domain-containing protein [Paludibacteraceae bacterium]|nr:DUF4465 domain-containing protein [Paludibacteraceae bacterium]
MKKTIISLAILSLVSCSKTNTTEPEIPSTTVVTFDDASLDSTGNFYTSPYTSGIISLSNNYDEEYAYWEGFAISNNTDTIEGSYLNQYSVISGNAHSGSNFAVAYAGFSIPTEIVSDSDITPVRLFINNTTYVYKTILNGNSFSRAFTDGDYYSVTFTGISSTGDTTGTVTTYLADFRNGNHYIADTWNEVSLLPLGICRRIVLTFYSTDTGDFGINTPCYATIDDFEYIRQ